MADQHSESRASETSQPGSPTLNEALLVGTNRILELTVTEDASLATILEAIARLPEELCEDMRCAVLALDDGRLSLSAAPSLPEGYARVVADIQREALDGFDGVGGVDDSRLERLHEIAASSGFEGHFIEAVAGESGKAIAVIVMYFPAPRSPTWFERHVVDAALHLAKVAIKHRRARQRREESEQRFRVLVETTMDSVWTSDPNGNVLPEPDTTWNVLTGQSYAEIANQGWLDAVHPEDQARVAAAWREAFENVTPFERSYRVRRADGTYASVIDRGSPVRNSDGTVREWIGAVTDETSRKCAEERLRFLSDTGALFSRSDDYERVLDELARISIGRIADYCAISVQASGTGIRRTVSAAHSATGLAEETNRGHLDCLAQALWDIDEPILIARVDTQANGTPLRPSDLERLHELRILSLAAAPIVAGDERCGIFLLATNCEGGHLLESEDLWLIEEVARRIVNAMDRARTLRELQTAIQARDDFLSVASHELKTPLTPLQLQIQAIERRPQGEVPAWLLPKLRVIRSQIERFARLVDQLLDISRIAEGRVQLELAPVDLGKLIHALVSRAETAGEISRSGSVVMLEGEVGVVGLWDRFRLEQIVGNLLSNAIKYGQSEPIVISWSASEGVATLRIRDHGIGIAAEDQARIFTRFERAVSVRHYGGFGLGLFIVRRLAEAMGGKVSVSSTLGQGSTFTVELPENPGRLPRDVQ